MSINKTSSTLLSSAARTATPTAVEINADKITDLHLVLDATAIVTTPSVTTSIEAYDAAMDDWYTLASFNAVTSVSTNVFSIGQNVATVSGTALQTALPERIRIAFTHADADSITYSVGANIIQDV